MKLTCQICGQYWYEEDSGFVVKTPICIVCKIQMGVVEEMNCNKCGHSWTPKISPKWDKFQTGEANFDQPFNPELHNTPTRCPKCGKKL